MNYTQEVTVSRHSSLEERKAALYQIYVQVLERQPYAFERKQLVKAEDDFLHDKIGVKRFLKALGHSAVYLDEFYHGSSNLKFLELCFKHFMGRAPRDRHEMRLYCDILMRDGVQALITYMIDSEEYRKHFGCFTVPYSPQEETYGSPKAYLETFILNHELHGRRGKVLPTMLWHELGLTCDGGNCRLENSLAAPTQPPARSQGDFLQMLRSMNPSDLEQIASALSADQREKLRQVLMQPA
ncbi:MAG: phycobilisome rod-core linker polypeptide [Cyanobacteria bacterium Co-bin8]|nr:phycobilisome rod-core linker polypeptide [Cyanobacteria bacterium Co-bin8]